MPRTGFDTTSQLTDLLNVLQRKQVELTLAENQVAATEATLLKLNRSIDLLEQGKTLVIKLGQESQTEVLIYIEETVTLALQSVFGEEYTFKVQAEPIRDQVELRFFVEYLGNLLEPKADTVGGGIIDVCSFALRMVVWTLENPQAPPIMLLDEPFRFISAKHRPFVIAMVKEISSLLGIQIIMVTHIMTLIQGADNLIVIDKGSSSTTNSPTDE